MFPKMMWQTVRLMIFNPALMNFKAIIRYRRFMHLSKQLEMPALIMAPVQRERARTAS